MAVRSIRPVCAALALLAACGGSSTSPSGGTNTPTGTTPTTSTPVQTTAVTMQGTAFAPPAIRVSPGAVVTFTNADGIAHNVTFTASNISGSGDFATGARSITMPTTAGSYPYRCTIHAGMAGTVEVQ